LPQPARRFDIGGVDSRSGRPEHGVGVDVLAEGVVDLRRVDPEEFLEAVRPHDRPTTSEVADAVGCKYRTAYDRLGRLEDDGRIKSREVENSLVWLASDD
jgi:hypothetical protein